MGIRFHYLVLVANHVRVIYQDALSVIAQHIANSAPEDFTKLHFTLADSVLMGVLCAQVLQIVLNAKMDLLLTLVLLLILVFCAKH